MKAARIATTVFLLSVLSIYPAGCNSKFFNPTDIGRYRPVPAVNVILDSLGVAEEEPLVWEGAEDPRPTDLIVFETDYVFGSGDTVRISIFELQQDGVQYINDFIVTETGKISIPEVGVVEAVGLTETELEEEIKRILTPTILKEPSVTVTLMRSQQRVFSISGDGVPSPSRYSIPRYDFRLLDALAIAGGWSQFNISYIYVSRSITGEEVIPELIEPEETRPAEAEQLIEPEQEMLEIIEPRAQRQWPENKLVIASADMITDKEFIEAALPESLAEPVRPETIDKSIDQQQQQRIEWIFKDGKWVPVQIGRPKPTKPPLKAVPEKVTRPLRERIPRDFGWEQIGAAGLQTRVIKIRADRLRSGDPRYNIVIKPGDNIQVPVDIIGEFWIYGNVNYQGPINITGRPITLKMAIASASGLGPYAWPKRCEVIRRIGRNKEEIVMVDLDKIASGEQPDFFIKPNDLINVGTHPTSIWRAILRNAFRATYGFGFIYDRNFADRDFLTRRPIPHLF